MLLTREEMTFDFGADKLDPVDVALHQQRDLLGPDPQAVATPGDAAPAIRTGKRCSRQSSAAAPA